MNTITAALETGHTKDIMTGINEATGEAPYILRITRDDLKDYIKAYLALENDYGDNIGEVLDSVTDEQVEDILFQYEAV